MITKLLARLRFNVTPPIQFVFEFNSLRVQDVVPDFKGVMVVNKHGKCSTSGPVLELNDAKLQSWNLINIQNGSLNVDFVVAGRLFRVSEDDVVLVSNYFINELPHLWKK
jgi:hypothetical protein